MSEPGKDTVAITGRDMVEFRRVAIELAITTIKVSDLGLISSAASQFLGLLMNLQPAILATDPTVDVPVGTADAPKAVTKKTRATTQSASPESTAAASAGTSNTLAAAAPSAPAPQAVSQLATQSAVSGLGITASTAPATTAVNTGSAPTLVSPPTDLNSAAVELKAAVGDTARGREFVKALLKQYGVELMSQIAAPKLADFVKDLKRGKAALTPAIDANDPLKGLI